MHCAMCLASLRAGTITLTRGVGTGGAAATSSREGLPRHRHAVTASASHQGEAQAIPIVRSMRFMSCPRHSDASGDA